MNEEALVQTLVALEICLMGPEADKAARLLAEDFVDFGGDYIFCKPGRIG